MREQRLGAVMSLIQGWAWGRRSWWCPSPPSSTEHTSASDPGAVGSRSGWLFLSIFTRGCPETLLSLHHAFGHSDTQILHWGLHIHFSLSLLQGSSCYQCLRIRKWRKSLFQDQYAVTVTTPGTNFTLFSSSCILLLYSKYSPTLLMASCVLAILTEMGLTWLSWTL